MRRSQGRWNEFQAVPLSRSLLGSQLNDVGCSVYFKEKKRKKISVIASLTLM